MSEHLHSVLYVTNCVMFTRTVQTAFNECNDEGH